MIPTTTGVRFLVPFGGFAVLLVAGADGILAEARAAAPAASYNDFASHCRAVDGDTLHCDGGRIRLLGIDAPELPGHCAQGRACAPGDPFAAAASLQKAMGDGTRLRIRKVGTDRYGRVLALVLGDAGDLSCWQLAHRQAIYKPRWDNDGDVAATCPEDAH